MTAKLRFDNRNKAEDVVEIYRTDTEVAKPEAQNLIATIAGDATEYIDTSAVIGQTYYYVTVAMIKDRPDSRIYGRPFKITVASKRGPGEDKILVGDERLGCMGLVDRSLLPKTDVFKQFPDSSQVFTHWVKIIRKGKIIYMPNFAMISLPVMNSLNAPGFRSGFPNSKKPAVYPPGIFDDNIATIEGYRFHVRLAYGTDDDWTPQKSPTGAISTDSEFFEILSFCNTDLTIPGLKVPSVSQLSNTKAVASQAMMVAEIGPTSTAAFGMALTTQGVGKTEAQTIKWAEKRLKQRLEYNTMSTGGTSYVCGLMVLELIED